MDKRQLIKSILNKLEEELQTAIQAARTALEEATNDEAKPENEYDTRGLEASYLAGAQAERAAQIEEQILIYKHLVVKDFKKEDAIESTALVEVEFNKKRSFVFLMSKGGGMILNFEGRPVQVVTPASPLGEALIGLKTGDSAIVEVGAATREYEVLSVR
jgi:transcription elongation GreA/GreB family factor